MRKVVVLALLTLALAFAAPSGVDAGGGGDTRCAASDNACHEVSGGGGGSRGGGSGGNLACVNTPSINICRGGGRP
jgi:hypothetical protein